MYICLYCGKEVNIELSTARKIVCPYCGHRVLKKKRAPVVKKVPAD